MARLDKLRSRRIDPRQILAKAINEVYERVQEDDAIKYALGAMQPIDAEYTRNTFVESERVQNQLTAGYLRKSLKVDYEHQGSVTSDTHIKAHSDIDLLVVETRFISLEQPLRPSSPYKGDPFQDLMELRTEAEQTLRLAFPAADLDFSGSKAISISGGSLRRTIDVVLASWLDTLEYKEGRGPHFRGVSVLDVAEKTRISNKPFLHSHRINERDLIERGNLRKVIRLLKSLKYDADREPNFSSYDIASVAWATPYNFWQVDRAQELLLVEQSCKWLDYLSNHQDYALTLDVPNGTRKIFGSKGASFSGLGQLQNELHGLRSDIEKGLARSFRNLQEARIVY